MELLAPAETTMSFGIYLVGYLILIVGLALAVVAAAVGLWCKSHESRAEELPPDLAAQVTEAVAEPAGPPIVVESGLQRATAAATAARPPPCRIRSRVRSSSITGCRCSSPTASWNSGRSAAPSPP